MIKYRSERASYTITQPCVIGHTISFLHCVLNFSDKHKHRQTLDE